MDGFRAGLWYQWRLFRNKPSDVGILISVPFSAAILLSVVRASGRTDLIGEALLAPCLMCIWSVGFTVGGTCLVGDRAIGQLELLLAAPAGFVGYVWGRVSATTVIALTGFGEAWAVGVVAFGARPHIYHPGWFAVGLVAVIATSVPTSAVVAVLLASARDPGRMPSYVNYPVYVLAGVFTPVSFLPALLQPLSRLLFLSWGADLLRDCVQQQMTYSPWKDLGAVLGIGLVTAALGGWLTRLVLTRMRQTGRASL